MTEAYIVKGFRSPVGKAGKGSFRFTRPDDIAAQVIQHMMKEVPALEPSMIDDLIVGNAVPEAEQGLQIGRMIALQALGIEVPGMVINRYCASGLEAIAIATSKIRSGMAHCIIAGGTESMSLVPTVGWKTVPNYNIAKNNPEYYLSMGLTAEAVANDYSISRDDQDEFAYMSHQKALSALKNAAFKGQVVPIEIEEIYVQDNKRKSKITTVDTDEGPRKNTTVEALSKLKPVFAANGSVTAGNSSQTSDGASFVILMSEQMMKKLDLEPEARLVSCASAGVHPRVMGIGPIEAVPKAMKQIDLQMNNIDLIELNEAFASQSLAVIRALNMDPDIVNVNGGAISLGHPLACTGCKLTVQIIHELRKRSKKYGLITACVGGGQGIAGVIERIN